MRYMRINDIIDINVEHMLALNKHTVNVYNYDHYCYNECFLFLLLLSGIWVWKER